MSQKTFLGQDFSSFDADKWGDVVFSDECFFQSYLSKTAFVFQHDLAPSHKANSTQALNFDRIISENEVSLEDLPIESLVQTDLDTNNTAFNKLFEDHFAILINPSDKNKSLTESIYKEDLFDLDLDAIDIGENIGKSLDITEPLPNCYINLIDLACDPVEPEGYPDSDEIFSINDSDESDINKKHAKVVRRQSTRIQNQIQKKIAEQIQRENIRLAKEAQRLNNPDYEVKNKDVPEGSSFISTTSQYLSMPTDLDAEDELNIIEEERKSDDDPNKLWCICKQPYGFRFMICCDNCSEWYHGDCVGITEEEGSRMEENGQDFICPVCVNSTKKDLKITETVVISDNEDVDELLNEDENDDDDDCKIIKAIMKPISNTPNIFQLLKSTKPDNNLALEKRSNAMTLSARTSICLNFGCKTLVNPKMSLYCSKKCIEKYTKMVKKNNQKEKVAQYGLVKGTKLAKMTRFVLAQIETETIQDEFDAPTEENLKEFLMKNPTYKVFQSAKSSKKTQDTSRNKKVNPLLTEDAAKRMKVVKAFAQIFTKHVSKKAQNEFRCIWQKCGKLEEALFKMCDESINEKYLLKCKELLNVFESKIENKLALDFLQDKLLISDLLEMTKDELDAKCKPISDGTDVKSQLKSHKNKKTFNITKTGISALLSDTTHLHLQHLYDINCKICNGALKTNNAEQQNNDKELNKEAEKEREKEIQKEKERQKQELAKTKSQLVKKDFDNIILPTESCTSESIVTSWFQKSSNLMKDITTLSPNVNNDELKVTSTVETPDMAIDMELCSTPVSEPIDSTKNNVSLEVKVDSSSQIKTNSSNKQTNSKPGRQKLTSIWEGEITYKEFGSISCKTYLVSRHHLGKAKEESTKGSLNPCLGVQLREEINLSITLGEQVKINGRTKLVVVQDYLKKLRRHSNKEFLVLRLHPINLEEGRRTYLKMFEFFHGKDRCGVIDQKKLGLKDCFIYPLNAHSKIPSFLMPLNGPGFEKRRPHMLLMLIVRTPLDSNIYKSFSPKYDQDHEFIQNHGINLEKYCQPPMTSSVCPSPIITEKSTELIKFPEKDSTILDNISTDDDHKNDEIKSQDILCEKPDNEELPEKDSDEPIMCDIINSQNDETSHSLKDGESGKEITCNYNFDQVFNSNKPDVNIMPFLTVQQSTSNHVELNNNQNDLEDHGDFDLRLLSHNDNKNNSQIKYCQFIENTPAVSFNVFTISPKHKRSYTLYDAHFDDPESDSKRAKYFFNPRFPDSNRNSNRSLPI